MVSKKTLTRRDVLRKAAETGLKALRRGRKRENPLRRSLNAERASNLILKEQWQHDRQILLDEYPDDDFGAGGYESNDDSNES